MKVSFSAPTPVENMKAFCRNNRISRFRVVVLTAIGLLFTKQLLLLQPPMMTSAELEEPFESGGLFLKEVPLQKTTTSHYRWIWKEHQWMENLCKGGSRPSLLCHHVTVLPQQKVSFCLAAKVASTSIRDYFFKIAEGSLVIPDGARYGVHNANWTRFAQLDPPTRKELLMSAEWTHVFFWKPVLDRFVSGYLDKVVNDCKKSNFMSDSNLAIKYYNQYGFSCEKHQDLESFVSFMEGVTAPRMEGHFAPQATLCGVEKFPYTDIIVANESLNANLKVLSKKLGVEHPEKSQHTTSHKTGAKYEMISLFEGKQELIGRILKLFEEDCKQIPKACDVKNVRQLVK